jgi:hypothetical protein
MIKTYPISDATIAERQIALYAGRIVVHQTRVATLCETTRFDRSDIAIMCKLRLYCAYLAVCQSNLAYWQGKLHEASAIPFMAIVSRPCKGCGIEIVDSRVYCNECLIEENV